jgi:predicted lipid-binding transport protein (Tim44 family)
VGEESKLMSQQEFEPRAMQSEEEHRPQYPYNWSKQRQQQGLPRDEPPQNYGAPSGAQTSAPARQQVPWWARPQPQQHNSLAFVVIVALLVVLVLAMGGLGIIGVVLGILAHLLGIVLGAVFALVLFIFLLILLILFLIGRAISGVFRPSRDERRIQRRAAHAQRRMARRAARRF